MITDEIAEFLKLKLIDRAAKNAGMDRFIHGACFTTTGRRYQKGGIW